MGQDADIKMSYPMSGSLVIFIIRRISHRKYPFLSMIMLS